MSFRIESIEFVKFDERDALCVVLTSDYRRVVAGVQSGGQRAFVFASGLAAPWFWFQEQEELPRFVGFLVKVCVSPSWFARTLVER